MSSSGSQLGSETVVEGYTIGERVRSRTGATTYEATDGDGQPVHLTAYDESCFPSALVRERSLRELRQLKSVNAEPVARVLAAGKLDDGGVYEVTEVARGDVLDVTVVRSANEVAGIMTLIGEALLAAQKAGIIHRNLGASVVIQTAAGLKVTGFAVGEPLAERSHGSVDTISPEQVQGKVVDQRSLIYNLAALQYQLRHGKPLFAGTVEEKVAAHVQQAPDHVEDQRLTRALAKEPRSRPMMLRQFLRELTDLGGAPAPKNPAPAAAPPPAARPSTRGWTMFMEGDGEEVDASEGAPQGASSEAPTSPEPTPQGGAPSTRGWTLFMEGDGSPAESDAAPPVAEETKSPSTRGWTMFMDDDGNEADPSSTGASGAETANVADPPASASPDGSKSPGDLPASGDGSGGSSQEPPPSEGAAPPTTRGWTLFMDEGGGDASQPVASPPGAAPPTSTTAPVAPTTPPSGAEPGAPVLPSQAAPAAASADPVEPATEPSPSASAPSVDATVMIPPGAAGSLPGSVGDPVPPVRGKELTPAARRHVPDPASSSPPTEAPATRGWTMFMDQESGEAKRGQEPGRRSTADSEATRDAGPPAAPAEEEPASDVVATRKPTAGPDDGPSRPEQRPGSPSKETDAPAPTSGGTQMLSPAKAARLRAEVSRQAHGVAPTGAPEDKATAVRKGWVSFDPKRPTQVSAESTRQVAASDPRRDAPDKTILSPSFGASEPRDAVPEDPAFEPPKEIDVRPEASAGSSDAGQTAVIDHVASGSSASPSDDQAGPEAVADDHQPQPDTAPADRPHDDQGVPAVASERHLEQGRKRPRSWAPVAIGVGLVAAAVLASLFLL
ncbi:MAG: hypothetical protein B7733_00905 [Myxococcales bacterium FL481]|nr:MAG: hypothetical protein B7733_00905 [Myxococcales bacterium FL481]